MDDDAARRGVPDCLACGACCFSTLPEAVRVWGRDHERLGDRAEALTVFIGNRCYMRLVDGHCAALVVDPIARRFACGAYDARPDVCRDLARGGAACEAERHEKGDRSRAFVGEGRLRVPRDGPDR
jgi:Fe-S-cluster containining protein